MSKKYFRISRLLIAVKNLKKIYVLCACIPERLIHASYHRYGIVQTQLWQFRWKLARTAYACGACRKTYSWKRFPVRCYNTPLEFSPISSVHYKHWKFLLFDTNYHLLHAVVVASDYFYLLQFLSNICLNKPVLKTLGIHDYWHCADLCSSALGQTWADMN